MIIAIVYDLHYNYSTGGAEYRNLTLAKSLSEKGHIVHLFGVKSWKGKDNIEINKNLFIHGVSSYNNKIKFKGKRRLFEPLKYSIFLFFKLMKYDFDIIDVISFPYFPYFSCKLYSIFKKKHIVVTWLEVWNDYWKNFGFAGFFGKLIEKWIAKNSKNNISISKLTSQRLKKICGKNIDTIECWIDTKEIDKVNEQKKKYDIISIGRHIEHKNMDLLIRIIAILKKKNHKIKTLLLGEGPQTINLLRLVNKLNLQENIDIISFSKSRKIMIKYLKSSKIFVLLSELEGFSISTIEAQYCGLPVITIDTAMNASKDYIIKKKNGFICRKDELDISYKIDKLLNDKILYEKMKKESIKLSKKFDIQKNTNKIIKYYNKLK